MKYTSHITYILLAVCVFSHSSYGDEAPPAHHKAAIDNSQSPYGKLRCIPMQDTTLTDGFWAKRFELAATKMLPALERAMLGECTANLNRMKQTAGLIDQHQHGSPWGDGDNYKWIEAMAHVYNLTKDPKLMTTM